MPRCVRCDKIYYGPPAHDPWLCTECQKKENKMKESITIEEESAKEVEQLIGELTFDTPSKVQLTKDPSFYAVKWSGRNASNVRIAIQNVSKEDVDVYIDTSDNSLIIVVGKATKGYVPLNYYVVVSSSLQNCCIIDEETFKKYFVKKSENQGQNSV